MFKSRIRKEIKEKLNQQTDAQRLRKSNLIKNKLFKLAEFKRAKLVMFYLAKAQEVKTHSMIEQAQRLGKKVLVPVILVREKKIIASSIDDLKSELSPGPYGILQPKKEYVREVPLKQIDLVLVPGLAFDRQGHRLGRGGGYYDKFLARLPVSTPRIGLAFDFQVLEDLPTFSHDVSVTKVISA
ncbi:MAG: 5-formyltetrahydrofolate cyclo-ligase [Omnitrophica bacterium]|nr:5-formyltetrahydrofolate cyclo-ligase [Candidatus Omnitrophota bacterium]